MRKATGAVIGAALVLTAVAGQAAGQTAGEPTKICIGWNQAPGHMAAMTWQDPSLGYLQNSGTTYIAEPIRFQGSGFQVTAIAAGQVDIAAMSIMHKTPKTVIFVTHDVQGAVWLADRVAVMSPRPGRMKEIVELESSRDPEFARSPKFLESVEYLWSLIRDEATVAQTEH